MKKITSQKELKRKLKIDSLKKLKDEQVQKRFITIAPNISPRLLKKVFSIVPELTEAFTETIKAMRDVSLSLDETKQQRWEVLKTIAESGSLTGDQILEAMRIIQEIEKREGIDWNQVFETAFKAVATIAVFVVVSMLSGGRYKGNR